MYDTDMAKSYWKKKQIMFQGSPNPIKDQKENEPWEFKQWCIRASKHINHQDLFKVNIKKVYALVLSWKCVWHVRKMLEMSVNVGRFHQQPQNVQQISKEWDWVAWHFLYVECTSKKYGKFYFLTYFHSRIHDTFKLVLKRVKIGTFLLRKSS